MFKPNSSNGEYTTSVGVNTDAGIRIRDGKFNHHMAIVFDIIYDHLYRMFNEVKGMNYIASSLTKLLSSNDGRRHKFFRKLLSDKKLNFYLRTMDICKSSEKLTTIPYNSTTRDYLLNECPDFIDSAYPAEFSLQYRHALENQCEKDGNFDYVINLFKEYSLEERFFKYILENIFYGKIPSWNNFSLNINLNSIFKNNERSPYIMKKWFKDANQLSFDMTYPVTCISDHFEDRSYLPRKLFLTSFMFAIPGVSPCLNKFDKSNMSINISLYNTFMTFFAHDAKLCVKTYIPSILYSAKSNAFFIGKGILNNTFYNKKSKAFKTKLNYTFNGLYKYLNLSNKDNVRNSTYRKKAIYKALNQLHDLGVISVDRITAENVLLNDVWHISDIMRDEPIEEDRLDEKSTQELLDTNPCDIE
jgi:hypothetical protein